jgi:hypothetical protein
MWRAGLPDLRVHVLLVQHEAREAGGAAGPVPPAPAGLPATVPRVPLPLPLLRCDLYEPLAGRLQRLSMLPMSMCFAAMPAVCACVQHEPLPGRCRHPWLAGMSSITCRAANQAAVNDVAKSSPCWSPP